MEMPVHYQAVKLKCYHGIVGFSILMNLTEIPFERMQGYLGRLKTSFLLELLRFSRSKSHP